MNRLRTGLHAPAADNRRSGNTWFSRIVHPASRLITQGAVKRLSSVFKKNHPARPSAGDVVDEIEEDSLQEVPEEAVENAKVLGQDEEDTRVSKQRSEPEFTEVEQLIKNKTFSREEFNRLTELLQSRIVDRSAGLKVCEEQSREELHGGAGRSNAVNAEAQRWREERQKAREEKNDSVWHNSLYDNAPTPIFGLTNSNSAFGAAPSPTPPADQMEDSMAEDPAQVSSPVPPVFGGQTASPAPSFVFGSQPTAPTPIFGLTNSNSAFGAAPSPTPPADQMEDSMAEDPAQVSSPVPPVFGGQTASPAPSFVFGSQPTAPTPIFGLTNSNSAFGAAPSPTPPADQMGDSMAEDPAQVSSPVPPVFGGQTASPAPSFVFGSQPTAPTPIFGLTNSNSAFGAAPSPTPPADQMEDSIAEDPAQVSSPVPPVFGGQTASPAPSFVFGSQPTAPSAGQSVFQFGAQPGPAAANPFASSAPSTFNPAGGSGLEFSGGGFYLGAGGDRCNREFIKAKRDKTRRK